MYMHSRAHNAYYVPVRFLFLDWHHNYGKNYRPDDGSIITVYCVYASAEKETRFLPFCPLTTACNIIYNTFTLYNLFWSVYLDLLNIYVHIITIYIYIYTVVRRAREERSLTLTWIRMWIKEWNDYCTRIHFYRHSGVGTVLALRAKAKALTLTCV